MSDTIAAVATGNVVSAIGILRVSGEETLDIIDRVFFPANGKPMSASEDRKLVYGALKAADGSVLDLCLCTISRGPHSYTGEDTAELQCHGSPTVLRAGLHALFAAGARQALAGEFSRRAFLNDRMDLTQAEAVIDLIHSETEQAAKNAAGQLGGAVLRCVQPIYQSLADIASHYHAVIDYPDEDIPDFQMQAYGETLSAASGELERLLKTFARGRVMTSGVPAAILGRPNAGKSSLLNALLGYDRAIVTDVPGTTRDTLEERCELGGVLLRLTDTAGLHDTDDRVEALGVERSRRAAEQAALAIAVFDASEPLTEDDRTVIETAKQVQNRIAVLNKSDRPAVLDPAVFQPDFDGFRRRLRHFRQGADRACRAGGGRRRALPAAGGPGGGDPHERAPGRRDPPRALLAPRSAGGHADGLHARRRPHRGGGRHAGHRRAHRRECERGHHSANF